MQEVSEFNIFAKSYWSYYLELEEQIVLSKKYVEFDETNHKTFSSNYLLLIQAICSEIDVVGKALASSFSEDFAKEKGTKPINRWWYELQDKLPEIDKVVKFADSYEISPWANYRVEKKISTYTDKNGKLKERTNYNLAVKDDKKTYETPKWWNSYNKIKHHRTDFDGDEVNYKIANLLNLSNSIAALFILETEYMKLIGTLEERASISQSQLFEMEDVTNQLIKNMFEK